MTHTMEKLSSNKVKFSFVIGQEAFDEAMQKAYAKVRGSVSVPGFRKGKAPRKLIESMYGERVFYDEAFDLLFPDTYRAAVEQEKIDPVDRPQIEVQQIGAGKELQFTAEVFVRPDVTLGNYKGLKATRHLHPVAEEDIDARIERDVQKATTQQEVTDRVLENGDIADIDYLGTVAGKAFESGKAEHHKLTIGSGSFIPGFEEQLIGMNIGEEKDIAVTFPAEYHSKDLAGKDAAFHVKLHGITRDLRPQLDDEFAADVSEHTTFDAYRAAIVDELNRARDRHADSHLENDLIQQAVDAADCDIPQAMIDDEIDNMVRNMKLRMAYQGLRYEDYLKYTGMTEDQIRDMHKADAANRVKTQLVMDAIRQAENITPSQEEIDAQIEEYAQESGRGAEEYKKTLNDKQLSYFGELAGGKKVVEVLRASAQVSDCAHEHDEEKISAQEVLEKVSQAEDELAGEMQDAEEVSPNKKPGKKTAKEADQ